MRNRHRTVTAAVLDKRTVNWLVTYFVN